MAGEVRGLATLLAICATGASLLASCAQAEPLSVGNEPVAFWLARGFDPRPSTRALPVVLTVDSGACGQVPQYAGYALLWERHRLVVTIFLRPVPPPPAGIACPLYAYVRHLRERVALTRALGDRALLDGASRPPKLVHAARASTAGAGRR